jgi:hypothetical protein
MLWFGLRRSGIGLRVSPAALGRYTAGAFLVFATAYLGLRLLPGSLLSLMLTVPLAIATYAIFLLALGDRAIMRLAGRS